MSGKTAYYWINEYVEIDIRYWLKNTNKTIKEIANILNVSIHTVYRLIESGELSAMKISPRKTVVKAEELERYIR